MSANLDENHGLSSIKKEFSIFLFKQCLCLMRRELFSRPMSSEDHDFGIPLDLPETSLILQICVSSHVSLLQLALVATELDMAGPWLTPEKDIEKDMVFMGIHFEIQTI